MLLIVLACSLSLAVTGQRVEDDWIDPYDMLNYDSSTKTMRKPAEPVNYPNVPTKRREHTEDPSQQSPCGGQVLEQQKQIEELKKEIKLTSEQRMCPPVFKRFLRRLLKEMQRVGLPSDSVDALYDAKIKLSRQSISELQTLLEDEGSWRTGALDNAISQLLVDLRPHDYEAWKWRFEDTFGVEIDTVVKVLISVLIMVALTLLWSVVSRFLQFRRLFPFCFFISIIWNWFYLYMTAFAEHQKNMATLDGISEKCTGVKRIEWHDNLKEWFRSTWTLQDDPCKKYYELLFVNPLLLVPPTKAISVTIVTLITEPLKHIGEGISDFVRALLKDLPVTLQIPVFLTIVLAIVVCMYGSVQAVFQHGVRAPFRRPREDPPPLQPQQGPLQGIEDCPQHEQRHGAGDGRLQRKQVQQQAQGGDGPRERRRVVVDTLGSEDTIDAEQNHSAESDGQEMQDESAEASSFAANKDQSKTKPTKSYSCQSENKPLKVNGKPPKVEPGSDGGASQSQPTERQPSRTEALDLKAMAKDRTSSESLAEVETVGVPVQETSEVSEE